MTRRLFVTLLAAVFGLGVHPPKSRAQGPPDQVLLLLTRQYRQRLLDAGIPFDPTQRTINQQHTAALEFWAAVNSITMDVSTITQTYIEEQL